MGVQNPPREVPEEEITVPRPALAARSKQTRPNRGGPSWIRKPSWVDLEALEDPQGMPQSSQKAPARAPKRFQNHLRIANVVFRNCRYSFGKTIMFEGRRESLGASRGMGGPNNSLRNQNSEEERKQDELNIPMCTITRALRAPEGPMFAIIRN